MKEHTPTPWRLSMNEDDWPVVGPEIETDQAVIATIKWINHTETPANAKHIVRCVNSFDDLLAALREIIKQPVGHTAKDASADLAACVRIARNAIAQAEGDV